MKIDTEEEIKLIETLVDRLGRKMAIVVITGGMIMSIQPAETMADSGLFLFGMCKILSIALIAITGQLIQGKLDHSPSKPESPSNGS